MPREPPVAWAGPIFTADTGLSPPLLLPGTGSVPTVHPADHLQTTQVQCTVWLTEPVLVKWLDLKLLNALLLFYSGEPLKTSHRLEDGQIGGQPEVIYHVFHTLLFGGLTLLFDGCVNISVSFSGVFYNSSLRGWLHKRWKLKITLTKNRLLTVFFLNARICAVSQKIYLLSFLQDKISVDSLHLHVHSFWCVFSRSLDDCV